MKYLVIGFTALALASTPMISSADGHNHKESASTKAAPEKQAKKKSSKSMMKQMRHATFMPLMMKAALKNKKDLKLTKEQIKQLKAYKELHSPRMHKMVEVLHNMEKQAKEMALNNAHPKAIKELGEKTLDVRHDIMMGKLKCRSFMKATLSPQQFQELSTKYAK